LAGARTAPTVANYALLPIAGEYHIIIVLPRGSRAAHGLILFIRRGNLLYLPPDFVYMVVNFMLQLLEIILTQHAEQRIRAAKSLSLLEGLLAWLHMATGLGAIRVVSRGLEAAGAVVSEHHDGGFVGCSVEHVGEVLVRTRELLLVASLEVEAGRVIGLARVLRGKLLKDGRLFGREVMALLSHSMSI
jgi:hypothetical protein